MWFNLNILDCFGNMFFEINSQAIFLRLIPKKSISVLKFCNFRNRYIILQYRKKMSRLASFQRLVRTAKYIFQLVSKFLNPNSSPFPILSFRNLLNTSKLISRNKKSSFTLAKEDFERDLKSIRDD